MYSIKLCINLQVPETLQQHVVVPVAVELVEDGVHQRLDAVQVRRPRLDQLLETLRENNAHHIRSFPCEVFLVGGGFTRMWRCFFKLDLQAYLNCNTILEWHSHNISMLEAWGGGVTSIYIYI